MINKYTDPIITNYRFDKVGSRASVPITESLTVNNGFLFLKEIPDRNNVVTIGNLVEVQKPEELDSETKFYIDYNAGIVYFDSKLNGTKVNVEYSGIGIVYYPASRIYLEVDENHEIIRTLSDIEGQLSSLTNLKNQQERLKQEIEERNGTLNKAIEEARKIDLSGSVDKANQAKTDLESTTRKANLSKTQLDESKVSADELNKNLLNNKNELTTLDNSLKAENEKATKNISDLDTKSASGKQVIDDLNSAALKSETAKANLDESNVKATQTDTDLKATTKTANDTKTSLEQLKNESSTLSNKLNEGNTTASSNIESLKSENQSAKTNIAGLQTENQNALSKQETLSSETAKANEAITRITELITSSTDLKNKLEQIVASGDLDKYITDPKLKEILTGYATKDDLSKIDLTEKLKDYVKINELIEGLEELSEVVNTKMDKSNFNEIVNGLNINIENKIKDKADKSSIPTSLSQLADDSTHRLVTDEEKNKWNNPPNPDLTDYAKKEELVNYKLEDGTIKNYNAIDVRDGNINRDDIESCIVNMKINGGSTNRYLVKTYKTKYLVTQIAYRLDTVLEIFVRIGLNNSWGDWMQIKAERELSIFRGYLEKQIIPQLVKKDQLPTSLSQLTNDTKFKTETEIQEMIANSSKLKKEVVTSLPTSGKDDVIYLVKDTNGKDNNNYLEYLWIDGKWELIGSTQVDLSGYAKNEDIKASKFLDIYKLNKDFRTALNGDQNFLKAIARDMFTLVVFDEDDNFEFSKKAGFESILYFKSQVVGVSLLPDPIEINDSFVKNNQFVDGECYITSGLLRDYNAVIQKQFKEISTASDLSPFTQQELEEAFK